MLKFPNWTQDLGFFVFSDRLVFFCEKTNAKTLSLCVENTSGTVFSSTLSPTSSVIVWYDHILKEQWFEFVQKESLFLQVKSWIDRTLRACELFDELFDKTILSNGTRSAKQKCYRFVIAELLARYRITYPTDRSCSRCSKTPTSIHSMQENENALHFCSAECSGIEAEFNF